MSRSYRVGGQIGHPFLLGRYLIIGKVLRRNIPLAPNRWSLFAPNGRPSSSFSLSRSVNITNDAEIIAILRELFAVPCVSHVGLRVIFLFLSLYFPPPFSFSFSTIFLKVDENSNGIRATKPNTRSRFLFFYPPLLPITIRP